MLKKTLVCAWLLAGLTTGCLDGSGTKDDTSTGANDSTNGDGDGDGDGNVVGDGDGDIKPDEHKPDHNPPDGQDAGDENPPGDDAGPVGPDPQIDAGADPDPQTDAGGEVPTLDAGSDPEDDAGPTPVLDAGHEEPDAGPPPVPDAGHEEPDAGPPPVPDAGHEEPLPEVPDLGAAEMTDVERAARVLAVMTEQDYRTNWKPFLQETSGPRALIVTPSHGNAVKVSINPVAERAIRDWNEAGMPLPLEMPNGSIVVKEIYKLDAMTGKYSLSGTNVMSKVTVLSETTFEGQWFYSKVSLANEASMSTSCVGCHNGKTNKTLWPVDPLVPGSGGLLNGVVPYDYLFVAYCADPLTPQCSAPGAEIVFP